MISIKEDGKMMPVDFNGKDIFRQELKVYGKEAVNKLQELLSRKDVDYVKVRKIEVEEMIRNSEELEKVKDE